MSAVDDVVTGGAVISGMPHADYLASAALSSSGARLLLPPGCPALFRYRRDHPEPPRQSFDLGTAAHTAVLGAGAATVVVDADDWRSKSAREQRDEARAAGLTPLLTSEADQVAAVAAAVRAHPVARQLLDPGRGEAELSCFWTDADHGIDRRARVDFVRRTPGRTLLVDLKTTASAERGAFTRSVFSYGYDVQGAYYLDAAAACGLGDDTAFLIVAVDKAPPHLVAVYELDSETVRLGRDKVQRALELYARCSTADEWPGYSDEIDLIGPPAWAYPREDTA